MLQMRRLNHSGTDVWAVLLYIVFTIALLFNAYIFWWHNRTYVSYLVRREEKESDDEIESEIEEV